MLPGPAITTVIAACGIVTDKLSRHLYTAYYYNCDCRVRYCNGMNPTFVLMKLMLLQL